MATIARSAAVFCFFLVASCAPAGPAGADYPLEAGTRITLKAFGHHYESEAVEVHDGYSLWKVRWGEHVVASYKVYRGIFPVFSREGDGFYHNEIDVSGIDALFPLSIGKEVSLEGTYQDSKTDGDGRLWTHISVRDTSELMLDDRELPVFVIDITMEKESRNGTSLEQRTLWYAPDLGFSLKTEYQFGEEQYYVRVLSADLPKDNGQPPPTRDLGTVMI